MSKRRLAAIMFTDIVGYDSLLKEDEKKAFKILKKNQRIHKRLIKKFNGRWLKDMESGTLASFSSNIEAVMCAVSVQKATKELEIPLRIGIHLGDVIFEKKDVLGDGVNIASRIHSLIDSHGIVISDTVYKDIKNKEGLDIKSLGSQTLKGVDTPVGIYKVSCQDESILDFTIDTGELIRPYSLRRTTIIVGIMVIAILAFALYIFLPKIIHPPSEQDQSILVLPCVNFTGIDTLDYFLAGMHDAMIGDIGKISALRVISTTTARTYKDVEKSIPEIASELSVNNIIEPTVICLGDSVCIRLKAISVYPEEKQLWISDFKVEKSEILNLYNIVTKEIADRISVVLTPKEEERLSEARSVDKEAYDLYMKGRFYLEQFFSNEALDRSEFFFLRSIEKDPTWSAPYAGLAEVGLWQNQMGFVPQSTVKLKIIEYVEKALELDPFSSTAFLVNSMVASALEWNWEKSEREFKKALELNPNDAMAHVFFAHHLSCQRRTKEALAHGKKAIKLDPANPLIKGLFGAVLTFAGDYQSAIIQAEEALAIDPGNWFSHAVLEWSSYFNGDYERSYTKIKLIFPFDDDVISKSDSLFYHEGYNSALEVLMPSLENNLMSGLTPFDLSGFYARFGNYSKALEWLEKGYEIHDPNMIYILSGLIPDELLNYTEVQVIIKKMNLPVD